MAERSRFEGRSAVVTGAGSGIGREIALRLADEGAAVLVVDLRDERVTRVVREIERRGGRALGVRADVADGRQVGRVVRTARSKLGGVHVLVNNAAFAKADDIVSIGEAAWDRELAAVLKSAFLCTKGVLPFMIEGGGGAIVNIASVNALSAFGNEAYSAAKAGMINLTQATAVRYGRHAIRCNAIAAGTIRTPAWDERRRRDPAVLERLARWYPLGRVGEPGDVAAAVLFLASDEAAWISGAVLRVDGGLLAGNAEMMREVLAESEPGPRAPR